MRNAKTSKIKRAAITLWFHTKIVIAAFVMIISLYKLINSIGEYIISNSSQEAFSQSLSSSTISLTFIMFSIFGLITTMHQYKLHRK